MKVLVTYFSQTGNTEKLAKAIFEAIDGKKEILPVSEVKSVEGFDLIFCGFPVQAHSVPMPVQDIIKQFPSGQKLAIFCTHGSVRGGPLAVTGLEHAVSLAADTKVLGEFGCRGKVSVKIIDALMQKPEHKAWAQEAQGAMSHPKKTDLEDGQDFTRQIMAKALGK